MRRVFGYFNSIVLEPVSAHAGTDDGAAGGDGGGSRSEPGGGDAAKTGITKDEADAMITKAINARFKTFEDKLAKNTEASQAQLKESFGAMLDEKLAALKPSGDDSKDKGKPAPTDLTQNPEFRALKKQNEDFARELQKERDEKAKARAAARSASLNQRVEAELAALGIVDAASLRKLLSTDNIVAYEDDDSDNVVFKDEEGGALPLKKGLESWVKSSPLAKRFMPATGADGSGEHRDAGTQRKSGSQDAPPKMSRTQLGQALVRAAQGG